MILQRKNEETVPVYISSRSEKSSLELAAVSGRSRHGLDEPIDGVDKVGADEANYSVAQFEGLGKRSVFKVHSEVRSFSSLYCYLLTRRSSMAPDSSSLPLTHTYSAPSQHAACLILSFLFSALFLASEESLISLGEHSNLSSVASLSLVLFSGTFFSRSTQVHSPSMDRAENSFSLTRRAQPTRRRCTWSTRVGLLSSPSPLPTLPRLRTRR